MQVNSLAALAVSSIGLDSNDHGLIGRSRATTGRVVELATSIPGNLARLGNPITLLYILLTSSKLDVTSLALKRALTQ